MNTRRSFHDAAFYLSEAMREANRALVSLDYCPESATREEQALAGVVAMLSLLKAEYANRATNASP